MGRKRTNNPNLVRIGGVIEDIIRDIRPLRDQRMVEIWDLWAKAIDPSIVKHAKPAAFRGGSLIVHVSSSTWIQHLRFMERQIVNNLNQAHGAKIVENIAFKIGKLG